MTAKSFAQAGAAGGEHASQTPARPHFTVMERIQALVSPLLGKLPASVLYKMSGELPIVMEGMTLDPHMQFIRAFQRNKRPFYRYCEPTLAIARTRLRKEALMFVRKPIPVGAVRDFTIPGLAGEIPVRHYAPVADAVGTTGAQPLMVFYHGGGFAVLDIVIRRGMPDFVC